MKRRSIIVGNWKMNKTSTEAGSFCENFLPLVSQQSRDEIIILPPFLAIPKTIQRTRGTNVAVGAQTVHWLDSGSYTGQISPAMLVEIGCTHVLIGHWESRSLAHETDEEIRKKVRASLEHDLIPIVCVGEEFLDRFAHTAESRLQQQIRSAFDDLDGHMVGKVIIAYEPVWSIGTGRSAKLHHIEHAHQTIRGELSRTYSTEIASCVPILYGGSVTAEGAPYLMAGSDINGLLVGGASLDPASFASIIGYADDVSALHNEYCN